MYPPYPGLPISPDYVRTIHGDRQSYLTTVLTSVSYLHLFEVFDNLFGLDTNKARGRESHCSNSNS